MANIQIVVENCNSIERAEIQVETGCLNIKYGPNGLGKSTIAKAIVSKIRNDGSLSNLVPFKGRGKVAPLEPKVIGVEGLSSALVFDEEYVSQFAFQQDEVLKNSFEIFIRTPDYSDAMKEIDELFSGIKKAFTTNSEIEETIKDLKELRDAFGALNKDGTISKSAKIVKAYGSGNKIEHIPAALKPFTTFIRSAEPSKWIAWQVKGNDFLKIGDTCPYCASSLIEASQKDTALAVAKEYDATAIGHLNTIKAVIERLGKYFSPKCLENLVKVTQAKIEITGQERSFLAGLRGDIDALIEKLDGLRSISFFSLRDVDQVDAKLKLLKIDLSLIDKLDSVETRKITDPINGQLDSLTNKIGDLKGKIGKQKSKIKKAIEANESSINGFLKSAGYKYSVEIVEEPDSYKMKLVHQDMHEHVASAGKHLSYGERNAFALVLFMHQVLSENPDIVILDDPISSFDKNKKFAIIYQLFHGKAGLRQRTTLMLTHDIEPAIDVIKSTARVFAGSNPTASFLASRKGIVSETKIESNDIQTFTRVCNDILGSTADQIIKSVYLRRRYEIADSLGLEYNLLASLFKKRQAPTIQGATGSMDMSQEQKTEAENRVIADIPGFSYDALLAVVNDDSAMKARYSATTVGYEKLQLFRIIEGKHQDDIITKFINESYHIENEYVMQLNPQRFEVVPEYVIEQCNRVLGPQPTALPVEA